MSEPTIDEMLQWLQGLKDTWKYQSGIPSLEMLDAIRAILLHHKHNLVSVNQVIELAAIRAFVERVEKRMERDGKGYEDAVEAELAAMEKAAEQK